MAYDLKVLDKGCEELGITLNEVQKQQFITFYEYLVEKNKVMNLTGITEISGGAGQALSGQPRLCEGCGNEQNKQNHGYRNWCRFSRCST